MEKRKRNNTPAKVKRRNEESQSFYI